MLARIITCLTLAALVALPTSAHAQKKKKQANVWTKPNQAKKQDPDFSIQGEYTGEINADGGMKVGCQVVALGKGEFAGAVFFGGLPGDGWNGERMPAIKARKADDGTVTFVGEQGDGVLKDGVLTIVVDGSEVGSLKRVERKSKTLGKKAPKDATVLFNGKSTDHWEHAEMDGKLLAFAPRGNGKSGTTTKEKFNDFSMHIEFRTPYMPRARGQGRGNSGIYLQGRYEIQMLDSFGLSGENNECGGIYQIAKPKENMCYPPLRWQTYDIDFTAAKYDGEGKLVSHPKMDVHHNGVLIHKNLELPHTTTAAPNKKPGPSAGPIYLQDHSNPVRYRNIWIVKK